MYLTTRPQTGRALNGTSTLEQRINQFFNDAFAGWDAPSRESGLANWVPPVDIFEEANEIRILAEVPGVNPEDVKISVENNVLTVQGTKHQAAGETSDRARRYERTYGTFERSFTLPATVEAEKIQARYEHGVLTVTLPKAEKAKPRQIKVAVARG